MRFDVLARSTSTRSLAATPTTESVTAPTVPTHDVTETEASPNWVEEILCFKKDGTKPDDPTMAKRQRRTQAWYRVISRKLYRRAFSQPLLRCLAPPEPEMVLAKLHEGICGVHNGGRTLAFKTL